MTTYEEDIVEVYYNVKDYFTIKNISLAKKGKEMDLLAVQVKDGKLKEIIHVEVTVSWLKFPIQKENKDEIKNIKKKFLGNESEEHIKDIVGKKSLEKLKRVLITGEFKDDIEEKLRNEFGGDIAINKENEKISKITIRFNHNGEDIEITLKPFSEILEEIKNIFKNEKKYLKRGGCQDPRYRAIQYLIPD